MNQGEELPGFTSTIDVALGGPYPKLYAAGDHSHVWDYWYTSTIIGSRATDDLPNSANLPVGVDAQKAYFSTQGYAYSPIALASTANPVPRPTRTSTNSPAHHSRLNMVSLRHNHMCILHH